MLDPLGRDMVLVLGGLVVHLLGRDMVLVLGGLVLHLLGRDMVLVLWRLWNGRFCHNTGFQD